MTISFAVVYWPKHRTLIIEMASSNLARSFYFFSFKQFLAIRRAISLNETLVLFC